MHNDDLKALFDQQAAGYDRQWARLAPMRDSLHFLVEAVFAELPADASILCVGAGTGVEMAHLAARFPAWTFTAVELSGAMLDVCRGRAESEGFADRCLFHEGYLETLRGSEAHDAATCFLVSQFIVDRTARIEFFRSIAARLRPGGVLASADLSADTASPEYDALFDVWMRLMSAADLSPERREQMRRAYANDVAVLPPAEVADIIRSAGFATPTLFHQAALIHAWFARRTQGDPSR